MTVHSDIPDPKSIIERILPLVPVTYGSLEVGAAKAHHYFFEAERVEPDGHLFSAIVRNHARRHLIEHGRLNVEFDYEELANGGLEITYQDLRFRLRKAFRGGAPQPGSFAMETFHAQTLFGALPESWRPNLYILWDVLRPAWTLAPDLYLACPKQARLRFPNVADCHWLVKLPNVALLPGQWIQVDSLDTFEDLPMHRPLEETGTDE
jgi:hypothetical protein